MITQEGRIANKSMPSALHFEQLIEKYKDVYKDQTTIQNKESVGHTVLHEFYRLEPPGRIWLESREMSNEFHEVTNEDQAAHICRIFLILAWNPLVFSDSEEEGNADSKRKQERVDDDDHRPESLDPTDCGIPPVLGSILNDFFTTFRTQNEAYQLKSKPESK